MKSQQTTLNANDPPVLAEFFFWSTVNDLTRSLGHFLCHEWKIVMMVLIGSLFWQPLQVTLVLESSRDAISVSCHGESILIMQPPQVLSQFLASLLPWREYTTHQRSLLAGGFFFPVPWIERICGSIAVFRKKVKRHCHVHGACLDYMSIFQSHMPLGRLA